MKVFGIVLTAVGSYALNNQVAVLSGSTVSEGIIVVGVFIMLLSLLGCLSAWKESPLFLQVVCVQVFVHITALIPTPVLFLPLDLHHRPLRCRYRCLR